MMTETARINMVKQQLRTGDVLDKNILSLYEHFPRHEFVPKGWENFAYSDMQIPLMHEEKMMTPLEEGKLLQALSLKGTETILEVGTGTGFLTALLSQLCQKVISIDYYSEFTLYAEKKLNERQISNVELITGDACSGWFDRAPYDVMIFTSPIEKNNKAYKVQLSKGGKLFVILGKAPIMKAQLHELQEDGEWRIQELFETNLPPIIDHSKIKPFVF